MDKRIVALFVGFGAFVVFILGVWLLVLVNSVSTGVRFIVAPDSINVSSGDRSFRVNYESVVGFSPGDYTLKLSRDGFESTETTVKVIDNEIVDVYIMLNPESAAAKEEMNRSEMTPRIERISGHIVASGGEKIEQEYPFINQLPIIDKYFSVKSCVNGNNDIDICVRLVIDNKYQRERALSAIKSTGVDVSKYTINYIDAQDPH